MRTKNTGDRRSGEATDVSDAPANVPRPADLEQHIENLRKQLQREQDRYARALADIRNHRLRVDRDASERAGVHRLPEPSGVNPARKETRWVVMGKRTKFSIWRIFVVILAIDAILDPRAERKVTAYTATR